MKNILLLLILLGLPVIFFVVFPMKFVKWFLMPDLPYTALDPSTKPDYAQQENWLARPDLESWAKILAKDDDPNQLDSESVDVFFIHPTTYFGTQYWNDPLDGSGHIFEKSLTLGVNASVFNGCCRVFAPKFRQATMFSYASDGSLGPAISFGAEDVVAAFDYYLANYNQGRSIIIAAHSQGADHGLYLLKKRFSGQKRLDKLVAAYLVGRPIGEDRLSAALPDIPICQTAQQTTCLVAWMTVGKDYDFTWLRDRSTYLSAQGMDVYPAQRTVCVNPLSWRFDEMEVPSDSHLGFYRWTEDRKFLYRDDLKISAQCRDGALEISPDFYDPMTFGNYYHVHDYGLFYKNIRNNTILRARTHRQGSGDQGSASSVTK